MLTINELSIQVKRTKRRSLGISVNKGEVIAHAPLKLSEQKIRDFVEQKLAWIKKIVEKQRLRSNYQNKNYEAGEMFLFLGNEYILDFQQPLAGNVQIKENTLQVYLGKNAAMAGNKVWIHRQLKQWYVQQAVEYLADKTEFFAEKLGLRYQSIKVRYYKSKWGSCSTRGDIHYNYLIILAPPMIVDYIVVHELAHLKQHNHSPKFWQLVATILPHYQQCRKWLKDNGASLRID